MMGLEHNISQSHKHNTQQIELLPGTVQKGFFFSYYNANAGRALADSSSSALGSVNPVMAHAWPGPRLWKSVQA